MKKRFGLGLIVLCVAGSLLAAGWPDPARFEASITAFEKQDAQSMPPEGAILCIGSSSMRMWGPNIQQDLAPLTVIPRGFGGSVINDVVYFADRAVFPYKPRAILLYEGDNDTNAGIPPAEIAARFGDFFQLVHSKLPDTRIYVISIKPSVAREKLWPKMQEANALLAELCAKDDKLTFIDASTALLNADGTPRGDVLREDRLHMTADGYKIWTDVIRPVLMAGEAQYEK